ncbi:MAG TPA: mannitol dehydrogenase family protein [Micavibrio sp.]
MEQDKSIQRLSGNPLLNLDEGIQIPDYDRSQVKTGIVHIGPSAFFRGHLAVYIDDLLQQGETDWGICAVSLRTDDVRNALEGQNNLYTVVEQSTQGNKARVIGSVNKMLVARESPQAVLDQLASPDTKLVTLTVTQSGYYYKNGNLDFDNEDIRKDLLNADEPTSTVGYLVKALEMRMERGLGPFTVMSCDNLAGNGEILSKVVRAYARERSQTLHDWIEEHVEFPSTMVDRIVPRISDDHKKSLMNDFSLQDNWPIFTEKFRQFVITKPENGAPMPAFERAGALMVDEVAPFELTKIRLLNGTHMALGMIGRLAGYTYAHEAINDPKIRGFVDGFMDEMIATLPAVPGVDLNQYRASVIDRLSSPFMKDELQRLARNGVEKLDSRFLQAMRDHMATTPAGAAKKAPEHLSFAVATWVHYLKMSATMDILDEKAAKNKYGEEARKGQNSFAFVATHPEIFGVDLATSSAFSGAFERHLKAIDAARENIVQALPAPQAPEKENRMAVGAFMSASPYGPKL